MASQGALAHSLETVIAKWLPQFQVYIYTLQCSWEEESTGFFISLFNIFFQVYWATISFSKILSVWLEELTNVDICIIINTIKIQNIFINQKSFFELLPTMPPAVNDLLSTTLD